MCKVEYLCKLCGKCCSYEIPMTILDIHNMASHLGLTEKRVFEHYIQDQISCRSSLFMLGKNKQGVCLFVNEDKKCAIHQAKPKVCQLFFCSLNNDKDVFPWTATYTDPNKRASLWEQSVAVMMTKAYINKNGVSWNHADFNKAIEQISDKTVVKRTQKLKLARNSEGSILAMLYDCTQCEECGTHAGETPVTLDDIRRIAKFLGIDWPEFFKKKIACTLCNKTAGLKLKRREHCVFFNSENHCLIKDIRPMHCRFTPCPSRTETNEMMDCLFLGSGTPEEQFRHQVAMSVTREYAAQCGVNCNEKIAEMLLDRMDRLLFDKAVFREFCLNLAPFRYVDDTLLALRHQDKRTKANIL